MPFVALDKKSGNRIDITKLDNPRLKLKSGEIVCQLCGHPMMIKAGLIIRPHFSHYAKCETDYGYHPQSAEHLWAKSAIAVSLIENCQEYQGVTIDFEVKIPSAKRVADILVTWENGWKVAHEVQLASITIEEIEQRTKDYKNDGIDTVWWIGKNANTPAIRDWCLHNLGAVYILNMSEMESS